MIKTFFVVFFWNGKIFGRNYFNKRLEFGLNVGRICRQHILIKTGWSAKIMRNCMFVQIVDVAVCSQLLRPLHIESLREYSPNYVPIFCWFFFWLFGRLLDNLGQSFGRFFLKLWTWTLWISAGKPDPFFQVQPDLGSNFRVQTGRVGPQDPKNGSN